MREFKNIPPVLKAGETLEQWNNRRNSLREQFELIEYGKRPSLSYQTGWNVLKEELVLEGTAIRRVVEIFVETELGKFAFPVYLYIPKREKPVAATVLICSQNREVKPVKLPEGATPDSFMKLLEQFHIIMDGPLDMGNPKPLDMEKDMENGHWPIPALMKCGHAAAGFYAGDVEEDNAQLYPSGLAKIFGTTAEREENEWGILAVWAFAASRVLDYLVTVPEIDAGHVGVIGHSRCGKAALWSGVMDERFSCVVPNNSGCCGSAISRGKHGENVASIQAFFPHWFAPAYRQYGTKVEELPFDQHMLLALVAPRLLYVTSGSEDLWADPEGEHQSMVLANEVYRLYGCPEIATDMPEVNTPVYAGPEGYHLRKGPHLLAEYDWMKMVEHVERNRE